MQQGVQCQSEAAAKPGFDSSNLSAKGASVSLPVWLLLTCAKLIVFFATAVSLMMLMGQRAMVWIPAAVAFAGSLFALLLSIAASRRFAAIQQTLQRIEFQDVQASSCARVRLGDLTSLQAEAERAADVICTMSRFLPEPLVRQIRSGSDCAKKLYVSRRNITIVHVVSDDFDTLATDLEPADMTFCITRFWSTMSRVAHCFSGTVEFLTHGAVWYFNTPDNVEKHEVRACAAALAMQEAIHILNCEMVERGHYPIQAQITIHTGDVMTGVIGGTDKVKFGCLGDTMSIATYLKHLCSHHSVGIILSHNTWRSLQVMDGFHARRLGRHCLTMSNRNLEIEVLELLGLEGAEGLADRKALAQDFERALSHYEAGNMSLAHCAAVELRQGWPHDKASGVLLENIVHCTVSNPPDAAWTGVRLLSDPKAERRLLRELDLQSLQSRSIQAQKQLQRALWGAGAHLLTQETLIAQRALCEVGLSESAVTQLTTEILCSQSEHAGIALTYLLSPSFLQLAQQRSGVPDPTFRKLQEAFFFGPDALGSNLLCPRDGYPGCALVDTLQPECRQECTHFLSWSWSYTVLQVRDALQTWMDATPQPETFLFMCFFVNNQYRILPGSTAYRRTGRSQDLGYRFSEQLRRIGRVVALLDNWDRPFYLTRVLTSVAEITGVV